jgi:hypothetical protein
MVWVDAVRVSFVWFEPTLELLAEPTTNAPMSFLGRGNTFGAQFELAQSGTHPAALEPPWENLFKQLFWNYYLERVNPDSFHGSQAWRALVPLRLKLASKFAIPQLPLVVAYTEGFFYPHGVAFGVTVELTQRKPIEEVVNALIDLQQNRRLVPPATQAAGALKLSGYAVQCLGALRARAFGGKPEPAHIPLDPPFSIATILGGDAAAAEPAIADQGPTHRLLEGLARWSPAWDRDALPKLADRRLKTKLNTSNGDALYASTRGRVVWFPSSFGKAGGNLSCYHRNLFYAALQVESLGVLSSLAVQQTSRGSALSPSQNDCAKRAAGILGRLHCGSADTYRSNSAKLHIEENRKTEINANRGYFNLKAL